MVRGLRRAPRRESEWLRELYAQDKLSLDELDEALDRALEWGDPERPEPDPQRVGIRLRLVVPLVLTAVVALVALVRDPAPFGAPSKTAQRWAIAADAVCADMDAAFRAEVQLAPPDPRMPLSQTLPLDHLASIRRASVAIEQTALERLRRIGTAPNRDALEAMTALEEKIEYEVHAVRAAEAGRRAGFELAMRQSVEPAIAARKAFAHAGSSVCSNRM